MPTLIDSLVLEIQLRGGNTVNTQLAATQRSFRDLAQGGTDAYNRLREASKEEASFIAAARVEAERYAQAHKISFGKANEELSGFYRQLQPRLSRVHKDIADESRRTGFAVARNFDPAVAAVGELATKALAAFGAIKALQAGLKTLGNEAAVGAQTNRAAFQANVNPGWLNRFQSSLFTLGNVPIGTTQAGVASLGGMVEHYRATGEIDDKVLRAAQQMHVNLLELDSTEKIQSFFEHTLPRALSQKGQTGAGAYELARLVGFEGMAPGLVKGEGALATEMQRAKGYAATDTELGELEKLQQSLNRFEVAMRGLYDAVIAANPELRYMVDGLTEFATFAKQSATAVGGITEAFKQLLWLLAGPFAPLLRAITGGAQLAGYTPGGTSGVSKPGRGDENSAASPAIPDKRSSWQRVKDWWHSKPAPVSSRSDGAAPFRSVAGLGNAAPRGTLDAISQAEGTFGPQGINYDAFLTSGKPGDPGVFGRPPKPLSQMTIKELLGWQEHMLRHPNNQWNSSAAGGFQIVSSNIRAWRDQGIISDSDVFNADLQGKLAGRLWANGGSNHWEGFKAHPLLRRRAEMLAREGQWAAPTAPSTSSDIQVNSTEGPPLNSAWRGHGSYLGGPGVKYNSKGQPYVDTPDNMKDRVDQSMQAIRAAQAAGRAWNKEGNGRSTTNDMDFHGGIHVHTAPGADSKEIASNIGSALQNNVLISNVGVE